MIDAPFALTMAAYNAEMNRRLYNAAGRLGDAARRQDRGAFFGSIHGTLSHLVWADRAWMGRLDGGDMPKETLAESATLFGSFDEMREARGIEDERIATWAAGLTGDWLAGELVWHSASAGRSVAASRSAIVMHLFNHQTHHRGQVHAMLTAAGETTGATDLPFVVPGLARPG